MMARGRAYLELTKPRLTALATASTAVGFWMAPASLAPAWRVIPTLIGASLLGGGASALNQWMERRQDALMARTCARPLPSGRLAPRHALVFGAAMSLIGVGLLIVWVNPLSGFLAVATLISYLAFYTPLKRITPLCTLVGAIPGALPPMIGWAAARGAVDFEAWVLGGIVFVWQLPHFLALAWLYRDDYARAGFRMLSVIEPDGWSVARQIVLYATALVPISLLPTFVGLTGSIYFLGTLMSGVWFAWLSVRAARARTAAIASRLFLASVGYLPLVWLLMVADKAPL